MNINVGPSDLKHGFKVIFHCDGGDVVTIFAKTATDAKLIAFNVSRQYSGIQDISVVGF
jgi:hypothetical protein